MSWFLHRVIISLWNFLCCNHFYRPLSHKTFCNSWPWYVVLWFTGMIPLNNWLDIISGISYHLWKFKMSAVKKSYYQWRWMAETYYVDYDKTRSIRRDQINGFSLLNATGKLVKSPALGEVAAGKSSEVSNKTDNWIQM